MNNNLLQEAFNWCELAKSKYNIQTVICGGCARDVWFGIEPKDVDIMIFGGADEDIISDAVSELGASLSLHIYNERYLDRLEHIWKVKDKPIDILLYNCETALEVVEALDFNINQFVLVSPTDSRYWGNTGLDTLVAIRGDHSYKREVYIREKHKQLMSL